MLIFHNPIEMIRITGLELYSTLKETTCANRFHFWQFSFWS